MPRLSTHALVASLAIPLVALAVTACADGGAPADAGPGVAITVSPLSLPGVTRAVFDLVVENEAGDTIVARTLDSRTYGAPDGSLSYVAPCDATSNDNVVRITLTDLYTGTDGATPVDPSSWVGPGAIEKPAHCDPNGDTAVRFDLTIVRKAQQGFFDIAVSFADIFCSAKLDCVSPDAPSEDLELLQRPGGARDLTAVLALACTSGSGSDTWLYLEPPVIRCDNFAPVVVDPSGEGNVDLDAFPSANASDYLFAASVSRTPPGSAGNGVVFWNVAMGLDESRFAAAGTCRLEARATATAAPLGATTTEFDLGAGAVYPVVTWNVELSTGAGRSCSRDSVDVAGSDVVTRYAGTPGGPAGTFACERASDGATACLSDPCPGFLVPGENACVFDSTAAVEKFTVPAGVTSLDVKLWGAGGGGGGDCRKAADDGLEYYGGDGGAGAYVHGALAVTPGAELDVRVGAGGDGGAAITASTGSSYYQSYGGTGGGSSRVGTAGGGFHTGALVVAGGGGGGGGCRVDDINHFKASGWDGGGGGQDGENPHAYGTATTFPGWSGLAGGTNTGGYGGAAPTTATAWKPGVNGSDVSGGGAGGGNVQGAYAVAWPDG
ncbi:MAG: hypothetical protein KC635_00615, partial [Myxococcales bacterium]|nr:hypothetical protein [Myxococcales bacterium]